MRSLARRTLRATAAVAGIAAGVGLAGPAFAAPAAPERPSTDEAAPAPDAQPAPNVGGGLPKTSSLPDLPQLFTIQGTGVYTADHGLPQPPTAQHLPGPALPNPDEAINLGRDDQTRSTDVNFRTAAPQDRDSAMQELDAASMFDAVPGQVLGATANNDVRY
ncbi:hypothetical protein FHX44_113387 [Pseudonocardia hierapolitana]|uniref:Uncharacterized protein n=1 Tax=Pseudonocardia hierapolitana TaxID=1128676 RepID=A0A561SRI7_9PSEU|nr:hypothetical protein [Pseudonocardia hierapolitana]TWF77477.1 hypothetical protein FHX44_113387 [Pseudonocardia hierapolitana]